MGDYALRFNAARIEVEELTSENKVLRDALEALQSLCGGPIKIQPQYDIATDALTTSEEGGVCEWTVDKQYECDDMWSSSCGEDWTFTTGGPSENGIKFCHNCGKPISLRDTEALTEEGDYEA